VDITAKGTLQNILKNTICSLKRKQKAVFIFQGIYSEYPLYTSKYIIFHLNILPFLWPFYLSILLFSYEKHARHKAKYEFPPIRHLKNLLRQT